MFFDKEIKHSVNLEKNSIVKTIIEVYNAKKFRIISTIYGQILETKGISTTYVKRKWQLWTHKILIKYEVKRINPAGNGRNGHIKMTRQGSAY